MLPAHVFVADQCLVRRPDAPLTPGVSVVLPLPGTCPPERARAVVASVLAQTRTDFELLVVEDGTTEELCRTLRELQAGDPRLIRVGHPRGFGLLALRANEGIELSRAPLLLVLDRLDPLAPTELAEGTRLIRRERLAAVGLADPHLALAGVWGDDLRERLSGTVVRDECAPRRLLRDVPRAALLALGAWRDYPVDGLRPGDCELRPEARRELYEQFVRPFYLRHRHRLGLERFALNVPPQPRDVAILRYGRDGGDHISFYNFDAQMRERGTFRFHAHPPMPVHETPLRDDILVTFRSFVTPHGDQIVQKALAAGLPMACYLDDDLVNLHEIPAFAYMAPGKPAYTSMIRQAEAADVVWVTNDYLASVYQPINPRLVPHMGCIRPELLPAEPFERRRDDPITVAYCGAAYRVEEFRGIWEALQRLAREFRGRVRFAFWGLNPAELPPLEAPTSYEPFSVGYEEYLTRLAAARFDVFITPLFEEPRCRLGKSLIKYYELALSGAVGVFSDVRQYAPLPAETVLKTANTPEAWYEALARAVTLPDTEREAIRRRCLEHVRETYTSSAQVHLVEAGCRAVEVHAASRGQRHEDGRPRLLLVVPEGAAGRAGWLRRVPLLRRYGIEPVVAEIGQGDEAEYAEMLAQARPFLVESLGHDARLAEACRDADVPYLPTTAEPPAGVPLALTSATDLKAVAGCARPFCFRGIATPEAFEAGTHKLRFEKDDTQAVALAELSRPLRVVIVGEPKEARLALERTSPPAGWQFTVAAVEAEPLPLLASADVLILPPASGELCPWLLDAMAAGVLIVTPGGRGMSELILDDETGIVAGGAGVEALAEALRRALALPGAQRRALLFAARRVAREEFHAERAASELMLAYSTICRRGPATNFVRLDQQATASLGPTVSGMPTPPPNSNSTVRVEDLNAPLRYEVSASGPNWSGLETTVYSEGLVEPLPVHLDLFDGAGRLMRTSTVEVQPGVSYQLVTFRFLPIATPDKRPYLAVLRPVRPAAGVLRVFEIVPARRTVFQKAWRKLLRGLKRTGLACRLVHEK